jgi:adenylate cyclase
MTTVAGQPSQPENRWFAVRGGIARFLRSATLRALIGAQLVALGVVAVRSYGWLQPVELLVYDALRTAWARQTPRNRVVLVGMTEADIHRWRYPLNDGVLADLLERLASWHPRAIGVDIYRDIPVPPGSERLAAVLKSHPEIVWGFKLAAGVDQGIPPPAPLVNSNRIALTDVAVDSGAVARRGLVFADDGVKNYPGLGMALALGYLAGDGIRLEPGAGDTLRLGKAVIAPLDQKSGPYVQFDSGGYQVPLEYYGGAEPFPRRTVADIMDHDRSALVAGRVVLVGDMLESVKDFFATPFSTGFGTADPIYGFEIHAHLADQLIEQALTGTPPLAGLPRADEDGWIWGWAVAGGILGLMIRSTFMLLSGSGVGVAAIAGIVYVAFGQALLLPFLPAALAWLGSVGLTNQLLYAASNRARARLRRSFEHYLPPHYVAELARNPEKLKLGGEIKLITVMFCDIRGFTTLSEGLSATELGQLINEFLTPMTDIIMARKGTIDKYIGDCIMAFWNAPLDDPDHAENAVVAAQDMRRKLVELNAAWTAARRPELHIGIGVNTGECSVGNFGSHQRFNYSLLGDPVNLSSRLEGLTKQYGVDLIIGEETAERLDTPGLIELDLVAVKGKKNAVRIYTLPPHPVESQQYLARHAALLAAYRQRDWDVALGLLEDPVLAAEREMAPVYGLFRERIERLKDEALPPDWDGVFVAHEK